MLKKLTTAFDHDLQHLIDGVRVGAGPLGNLGADLGADSPKER